MQRLSISTSNRALRLIWQVAWILLYRPSPTPLHAYRRWLLRCFGAQIAKGAHPYPRAKIWAPWNLTMDEGSCIANDVDCYNVSRISIGYAATVSQYSYLCTASHDYRDPSFPLVAESISVKSWAWVAADCFIGPGVTVEEGCVVGARSTVLRSTQPWTVTAGSPLRTIRSRDPKSVTRP
jgi:putative colanic acid biosynthesis acetyltransferase WcaF